MSSSTEEPVASMVSIVFTQATYLQPQMYDYHNTVLKKLLGKWGEATMGKLLLMLNLTDEAILLSSALCLLCFIETMFLINYPIMMLMLWQPECYYLFINYILFMIAMAISFELSTISLYWVMVYSTAALYTTFTDALPPIAKKYRRPVLLTGSCFGAFTILSLAYNLYNDISDLTIYNLIIEKEQFPINSRNFAIERMVVIWIFVTKSFLISTFDRDAFVLLTSRINLLPSDSFTKTIKVKATIPRFNEKLTFSFCATDSHGSQATVVLAGYYHSIITFNELKREVSKCGLQVADTAPRFNNSIQAVHTTDSTKMLLRGIDSVQFIPKTDMPPRVVRREVTKKLVYVQDKFAEYSQVDSRSKVFLKLFSKESFEWYTSFIRSPVVYSLVSLSPLVCTLMAAYLAMKRFEGSVPSSVIVALTALTGLTNLNIIFNLNWIIVKSLVKEPEFIYLSLNYIGLLCAVLVSFDYRLLCSLWVGAYTTIYLINGYIDALNHDLRSKAGWLLVFAILCNLIVMAALSKDWMFTRNVVMFSMEFNGKSVKWYSIPFFIERLVAITVLYLKTLYTAMYYRSSFVIIKARVHLKKFTESEYDCIFQNDSNLSRYSMFTRIREFAPIADGLESITPGRRQSVDRLMSTMRRFNTVRVLPLDARTNSSESVSRRIA